MYWSVKINNKPNRALPATHSSKIEELGYGAGKTAAELANINTPGIGPLLTSLLDGVKSYVERLRESVHKDNEERLDCFYKAIIQGESTVDEQVARALIDDRDFHAIVRALLADIEAEKTNQYATLARGITRGTVDKSWRRHFVLCLRDLSAQELKCLQQSLVAKNHSLMSPSGSKVDQADFLGKGQPGSHQAIMMNNLTMRGFVNEAQLSTAGEAFVKACWPLDQLTPTAIGFHEWKKEYALIVNYEIGQPEMDRVAQLIQDALHAMRIKSAIVAISYKNQQHCQLLSTMAIVFNHHSEHMLECLSNLADFSQRIPTLLVNFDNFSKASSEISADERISFVGNNEVELVAQICRWITNHKKMTK